MITSLFHEFPGSSYIDQGHLTTPRVRDEKQKGTMCLPHLSYCVVNAFKCTRQVIAAMLDISLSTD